MKSIGIRELRQRASEYLRLVEAGERIEVTDRGRPIAMISPIPEDESPLQRLERLGLITGPKDPSIDLSEIVPGPPAPPGTPTLTELLLADREAHDF
jgi:prevent-host-death family protein